MNQGKQQGRKGAGGGGDGADNAIAAALKSSKTEAYRAEDKFDARMLDVRAQEVAKELQEITTTQLRRFYEQVVAIKRRLDLDATIPDADILAQMAYLKASAAYAGARKTPVALVDFVVRNVNSIKTKQDFLDFQRHFEAVIAFHKVFGNKD